MQRQAVVVGGGFMGLEMAENLALIGLRVTDNERFDQVLAPLDQEFARIVESYLTAHGVQVVLNDAVAEFRQ